MSFYRALLRNPSVKRRAGHGFSVRSGSVAGKKAFTTKDTKVHEGKPWAVLPRLENRLTTEGTEDH